MGPGELKCPNGPPLQTAPEHRSVAEWPDVLLWNTSPFLLSQGLHRLSGRQRPERCIKAHLEWPQSTPRPPSETRFRRARARRLRHGIRRRLQGSSAGRPPKKFLLAAPAASALRPGSVAGACRLFNTGAPSHRGGDDSKSNFDAFAIYGSRIAPGFSYPQERGFWVSKEDDDAVELKMAMLGVEKDQVKVSVCQDTVLVKWEGVKGPDADEDPKWYNCCINLSAYDFKLDRTKAKMKGRELTVTVPKIKGKVDPECIDITVQ